MKSTALHRGLTQIALAGLLAAVVAAMSGCASMAQANSRGRTAGLVDSEFVSKHPPNANTLYGMARLLRSQGKHGQAEFVLLSLERDHPTFSPTYNDLAEIRMSQNRFDEATEYLDKGIAVAPNDAVLLNNAGVCSLLTRDFESALVYFKRASAIAPYKARYRANVALAMGLSGEIEGSRALYGQIVSAEEADFNTALIRELARPEPVEQTTAEPPAEASYQEAVLEAAETARAVETEETETSFTRPVLEAPEPVVEPAATESIAEALEADVETLHAETVDPVIEPATPVESFTNSDVEAHEAETAVLEVTSDFEEGLEPQAATAAVGFQVEAVEPEAADIEKSLEPRHAGNDAAELSVEAATAEVETAAEAVADFAAPEEAHVAFAIEAGEPAVGDASAFVFEDVELEEVHVAPGPAVQEREWVEGEYLLRETAPEEHFVLSDSESAEVPASMLEEFVAAEAAAIEAPPAGDVTAIELAEADVLEQLDEDPADDSIETKRVDESTD